MEPKMAQSVRKEQALQDPPVQSGGLCADTIVLTLAGELPASELMPGMRIITRDSGVAVLRHVNRRRWRGEMIAIKAGSLGHRRPPQDLLLPPQAQVLVRDWRAQALFGKDQALVAISALQDGEYVKPVAAQDIELIELIFDAPHILYAGGLELACHSPT